ncbi:CYCLIN D3 [Rhynchospora pubera]|uniref:CYCLIN D3 n=1 Tax=Rhynchospora pubera TaxID=906938 RepID=A0AAV8HG32_9POAL|nr:CYCLIN D3 [Rhynchospora pubera]
MTYSSMIDPLYCQEEYLDLPDHDQDEKEATTSASLTEEEKETNLHLIYSLSYKETETNPKVQTINQTPRSLGYLLSGARRDMVAWVKHAVSRHGFTTQTALLSVNYLDRCFLSGVLQLHHDKPWMGRLAAVACFSLAAKIEETRVPLLLDLQLPVTQQEETNTGDGTGFLFEAKTVRRMELLVLTALEWRLNPVTALSFIQPLVSLLYSGKRGNYITSRCEAILLSVLDDWRWVKHAPSVWATAALLRVVEFDETECIISLIKVSKEDVEECYGVILECTMANDRKRKHPLCNSCPVSPPASPSAVVGACFSCDNSLNSCDSFISCSSSTASFSDRPVKRAQYDSTKAYSDGLLRDEESRQAWGL